MPNPEHRPDAQNRPVSDPQAKDDPEVVQRCRRCTEPLSASHKVDLCRACQRERARAVCLHRTVVALPEADFRRWLRRVLWERACEKWDYVARLWNAGVERDEGRFTTSAERRACVTPNAGRLHLRWSKDYTVDEQALPLAAAGKEKDHG